MLQSSHLCLLQKGYSITIIFLEKNCLELETTIHSVFNNHLNTNLHWFWTPLEVKKFILDVISELKTEQFF